MSLQIRIAPALFLLSGFSLLAAQMANVPTRTLSRPEVELADPFSRLVGVRELRDGRLIITDMLEKMIAVVDLTKGTSTKIGTEGTGPGEYTMPSGVIAVPGDTTLVSDMGRKYLKVAPSGQIAGDYMPPSATAAGGGPRMMVVGPGGAGIADGRGRIYSRGSNFVGSPDMGMTQVDSAPITRLDRGTGKSDTVAYVRMPRADVQQSRGAGGVNVQVRVGGNMPFTAQDAWTVAPDGRIALVSPSPYRVTWISPTGQRTVGQPIPYQQVKVTEAEKQAYRDNLKASPPTGISVEMRDGGAGRVTNTPVPFREPDAWPEAKAPYAAQNAVLAAPNGELWILKQLPHTEKNPTYDIIGARGELTGRVVIPERSRVVAFGENGAVYVVRRDSDDLEYIQRHRLR